jgi:hypothetical protein
MTKTAIFAFVQRGLGRRGVAESLLYAAALAACILLLAGWIAARVSGAPAWEDGAPVASWTTLGVADFLSVLVASVILLLVVPAQVAAAIAEERRAGTLDQLRTTPLAPSSLLAGFVLGGPARWCVLAAGPLLLHLGCAIAGTASPSAALASTAALLAGSLLCALVGASAALAPQNDNNGPMTAVAVAGFTCVTGLVGTLLLVGDADFARWAFAHPAAAVQAAMLAGSPEWSHILLSRWKLSEYASAPVSDWLAWAPLWSLAVDLVLAGLLARAACRRLARPEHPFLAHRDALALFVVLAAALVAPVPIQELRANDAGELLLVGLFLAMPVIGLLVLAAVPDRVGWTLLVRSGRRCAGAPPWHLPASMVGLFLVAGGLLHLAGPGIALEPGEGLALAWTIWSALMLAPFALFASVRYRGSAARIGFCVAIALHLQLQLVCAAAATRVHRSDSLLLELGAVLALLVPAWVLWRLRVLRRRASID